MTRKKVIIASLFIILGLITGIYVRNNIVHNKKDDDYKTEFYNKLSDTFKTLCYTEGYQYIDENYLKKSSDIFVEAQLDKFSINPNYEGLKLSLHTQKNDDFSHSLTDIRAMFRGIQIISGQLSYNNKIITLYSPSIYDKALTTDMDFIKKNIALVYGNNVIYQLITEFIQMYPDELKDISDNVCVTHDNGYGFTIKADATKSFLYLLKDYIFEGKTCTNLITNHIIGEYYANPNIKNYYTLEEYKIQFFEGIKPSVQNIFIIAADLINFDVTINFKTDPKGNISSITYNDGNDSIEGKIDVLFIPYNNTYNLDGSISLRLMENILNIKFSQINSKEESIITTSSSISLELNKEKPFSLKFNSIMDINKNIQDFSFEIYEKNYEILLSGNGKYSSHNGNILEIDEEECNISEMNILELTDLIKTIQDNLTNLKERLK